MTALWGGVGEKGAKGGKSGGAKMGFNRKKGVSGTQMKEYGNALSESEKKRKKKTKSRKES